MIDTAFTKEHQPVSDLAVVQRAAMVPIKDRRLAFGGPYEDILSAIFLHRGIESLDELATGAKDLLHFNQLNGIQAAVELFIYWVTIPTKNCHHR